MSVEDAYASGLFDGEGCVIFTRRSKGNGHGWTMELQLSNCDIRALKFMEDQFGGHTRIATVARNGARYPIGMWKISGIDAESAAKRLVPYSILKREQLEIFLKGRETVVDKGMNLTNEVHKLRNKYAQQITKLKRPQVKVI